MMNKPISVATQTEVNTTVASQTETHTTSVQVQTDAGGNLGQEPAGVRVLNAISAESLKENDDMTKCHTSLPKWSLIVEIFLLFTTPSRTRLNLQDELILVLVKLRLNPPFQDLAY